MNIRKFWRLSCLTVASLFWASCGGDSNPQFPMAQSANPDSSADANGGSFGDESSSSTAVPESSSSEIVPQSSSSDAPASSSSAVESSSSKNGSSSSAEFVLARDPSIGCQKKYYSGERICYESCDAVKNDLKSSAIVPGNKITYWERALESCRAMEFASSVVYGTPFDPCPNPYRFEVAFECSNDSTYKNWQLEDNRVYTSIEEYNEAHGISSSSAPESSSSAENLVKNCPHEDYVSFLGILADVQHELYEKIEQQLENGENLSEPERTYLENLLDREKKTLRASVSRLLRGEYSLTPYPSDLLFDDYYYKVDSKNWFSGYIAKTKTCEDGMPVKTERYQEKYDEILAECMEIIENKVNGVSAD